MFRCLRPFDMWAVGDEIPADYYQESGNTADLLKNGFMELVPADWPDPIAGLDAMSMAELRHIAREIGAPSARSKAELIANIRAVEK